MLPFCPMNLSQCTCIYLFICVFMLVSLNQALPCSIFFLSKNFALKKIAIITSQSFFFVAFVLHCYEVCLYSVLLAHNTFRLGSVSDNAILFLICFILPCVPPICANVCFKAVLFCPTISVLVFPYKHQFYRLTHHVTFFPSHDVSKAV